MVIYLQLIGLFSRGSEFQVHKIWSCLQKLVTEILVHKHIFFSPIFKGKVKSSDLISTHSSSPKMCSLLSMRTACRSCDLTFWSEWQLWWLKGCGLSEDWEDLFRLTPTIILKASHICQLHPHYLLHFLSGSCDATEKVVLLLLLPWEFTFLLSIVLKKILH